MFFSQVVTATVLKKWVPKGIQSVATKIAIQMACKLGGEPWTVPIPVKGLMVIGKFWSQIILRKKYFTVFYFCDSKTEAMWIISYSKCSNWRWISKLASNFECLFTFGPIANKVPNHSLSRKFEFPIFTQGSNLVSFCWQKNQI